MLPTYATYSAGHYKDKLGVSRERGTQQAVRGRKLFPGLPGCGIIHPHTASTTFECRVGGGFGERTNWDSRTCMEFHGAPG